MASNESKKSTQVIPFYIWNEVHTPLSTHLLFEAHQHKEMEMLTVTEGEAEFCVGQSAYHLRAGETLVVPPYTVHRAVLPKGKGVTYYCSYFCLEALHAPDLKNGLEKGTLTLPYAITSAHPLCHLVFSTAEEVYTACTERRPGWELEICGKISLLFSAFLRGGEVTCATPDNKDKSFCRRVVEYIDAHYNEPITSASTAGHLYLNNSYFCRLFKKNFSHCFTDYLTVYRIEKAKILLRTSELSITDVAMRVGFSGTSYFCKTFKRLTEHSPSHYRKTSHPLFFLPDEAEEAED